SHPCRWNYYLMEETRPGEYMPVLENERGTFIYNSKDLCMIEHVDKLIRSGLDSFKIEGRVKTEYYLATVVKAYRDAIDRYFENPEGFETDPVWLQELKKVSHRDYTTGFFFGKPGGNEQNYETSSYIREYELLGIVEGYDPETGLLSVIQKNRFFKGSEVEFLRPHGSFVKHKIEYMENEDGTEIEVANRPQAVARIRIDTPIETDSMMRAVRGK
ncbi:MAG: U32 family peptidase C-terminal domain-containing protein, partial [Clostridia bacterium]|nr:U32 family peptidase C-terminal domain-containing protein [Clostridia bacterium]